MAAGEKAAVQWERNLVCKVRICPRYCCRQNSAMRTDVNTTREHVETDFMLEDVLHRGTDSLSSSFDSDSVYAEDSCCCYFPVVHYNSVHVPGAVQPSLDVG